MYLDKSLESFLKDVAEASQTVNTIGACFMSSMLSAGLTAKAAEVSAQKAASDADKATLAQLNQAAKSRLAELVAVFERETATPANQKAAHLIFEAPAHADPAQVQKDLKASAGNPLAGYRVCFDLMKLIHRLAPMIAPSVACDLETAMNLNLAALSALRTHVELSLSHLGAGDKTAAVQNEMRSVSEKTQGLTEEIIDAVRGKIF